MSGGSAAGPLTGLADAVMAELGPMLERVAAGGEAEAVDLRSLPMSDADRDALAARLGTGEVDATLAVAGESRVRETAYPGVWWVRHMGADGRVASEHIHVTRVPDILCAHPQDMARAAGRLAEAAGKGETEASEEA
jgi:hydrogenase-1 operon protein HyaF